MTAIVQDNGKHSLSVIADDMDIPLATAHRAVLTLQHAGYLIRSRRGYYHPGPVLTALAEQANKMSVATGIARPILAQLAAHEDCLAHLGVFEEDMVTYLLKEGADKDALFTRKDMQLEAYCSGLGKVLLAALDDSALDAYLAGGPFVPLTRNTIIDPQALRAEIAKVRKQGFAVDNCEIRENLFCMAAPLSDDTGHVFAAISLSFSNSAILRSGWKMHLSKLRKAAATISKRTRAGQDESSSAVIGKADRAFRTE